MRSPFWYFVPAVIGAVAMFFWVSYVVSLPQSWLTFPLGAAGGLLLFGGGIALGGYLVLKPEDKHGDR